ncbi:MAG: hypothetical protein EAZ76_02555 [Nostocales cyanobacterium]|nr:MAG: hypothetical protein EAZ87_18660 [Nostocales cyanobacterium]TAF19863.1 MAG: hypothetical protein EAZ76_02555 [Nostocales cyanobacterium]
MENNKNNQKNHLFTEISPEEAAAVSGGSIQEIAAYLTIVKELFPDMIKNPIVINTVLLMLLGVFSFPKTRSIIPDHTPVNTIDVVPTEPPEIGLF